MEENKKYIIKRLGVHDGYYKADRSLAKKMEGMEVVPVGKPGYREEAETKVLRKGQPAVTLFEEGTYFGDFAIPELHVDRTHLSEAYLRIVDVATGKSETTEVEKKTDATVAIEKEIERLTELLIEVRGHKVGEKTAGAAIAEVVKTLELEEEIKNLVSTDSKGTLVVEDDSKLPKTAVKPGFYKVDEEGNPDPDKPGEEPSFPPVAAEDKQAKFDRAETIAEEKRQAALKEKKGGKK